MARCYRIGIVSIILPLNLFAQDITPKIESALDKIGEESGFSVAVIRSKVASGSVKDALEAIQSIWDFEVSGELIVAYAETLESAERRGQLLHGLRFTGRMIEKKRILELARLFIADQRRFRPYPNQTNRFETPSSAVLDLMDIHWDEHQAPEVRAMLMNELDHLTSESARDTATKKKRETLVRAIQSLGSSLPEQTLQDLLKYSSKGEEYAWDGIEAIKALCDEAMGSKKRQQRMLLACRSENLATGLREISSIFPQDKDRIEMIIARIQRDHVDEQNKKLTEALVAEFWQAWDGKTPWSEIGKCEINLKDAFSDALYPDLDGQLTSAQAAELINIMNHCGGSDFLTGLGAFVSRGGLAEKDQRSLLLTAAANQLSFDRSYRDAEEKLRAAAAK